MDHNFSLPQFNAFIIIIFHHKFRPWWPISISAEFNALKPKIERERERERVRKENRRVEVKRKHMG
jgi:hypothetical protein